MRDTSCPRTELLILDEAERLNARSLEQLRDHFDRSSASVGPPGGASRA